MNPIIIGNAELYLGDCREILPTLPQVDACIADPPYEAEAHTFGRRTNGRAAVNGVYAREMEVNVLDFAPMDSGSRSTVSREFARLARGWILVFCQAEAVSLWRDSLEGGGAKYKRPMIWVKPDSLPQMSGDRPAMGYESIVAAWGGEGRSKWNGGGKRGVFTFNKGESAGRNEHQTQKPVLLMNELVSLFTQPANVILDPFMGSGTTGVACMNLGRKFIGIEIEPKYFAIACERVENAQRQQRMFD
jgi:DNA modification methylase